MKEHQATEKLRILLPHWVEHNREHEAEFRKWAALAGAEGAEEVAQLLAAAASFLAEANHSLAHALEKMGGGHDHRHHHHHGD